MTLRNTADHDRLHIWIFARRRSIQFAVRSMGYSIFQFNRPCTCNYDAPEAFDNGDFPETASGRTIIDLKHYTTYATGFNGVYFYAA